jgi:hypothetical protein
VADSPTAGARTPDPAAWRTPRDNRLPVLLPVCCGSDVPQKARTACLLTTGASGAAVREIRTSRTVTSHPQELARWLQERGCRHVALESTGAYGEPAFKVLEPAGLEVVPVNARHVKNVPGRKTDAKGAEWLATRLRAGLLRARILVSPRTHFRGSKTTYPDPASGGQPCPPSTTSPHSPPS